MSCWGLCFAIVGGAGLRGRKKTATA